MPDALPIPQAGRLAGIIAWLTGCIAVQGRPPRAPPPLLVATWTPRTQASRAATSPPDKTARAQPDQARHPRPCYTSKIRIYP